jgi:hypothetical protein
MCHFAMDGLGGLGGGWCRQTAVRCDERGRYRSFVEKPSGAIIHQLYSKRRRGLHTLMAATNTTVHSSRTSAGLCLN